MQETAIQNRSTEHRWSRGFESLEQEFDYRVIEVDGRIPLWLRGTLFRNGPGRNSLGGHWFPHWFDGDGMISAVRFDDRGLHYRNRYVRTENYVNETREGRILYRGFGKMRPGGIVANALRAPGNVSNTSVVMLGEKLLSLWEGGPPYALDPETLATLGVEDFSGQVRAFSAHPKIDPRTGDLYNFGIDYGASTSLTPYRVGRDGALERFPPVTLPYPVMNHDFVLTARHLVFCLGPILVHPLKMIFGLTSFDGALHWDGGKPTLILLIPRDRDSAPRWIETDGFFQFHFANGYEDDGALILDLTRYPDYETIGGALRTFHDSEWPADGMAALTRLRVDLATGQVQTRAFPTGNANEFPRMDPRRVAHRYRFAYIASNPPGEEIGLQQRLTRVDMDTGETISHDFGPGRYPGEPVFIPAPGSPEEDDGVVVTLVYDAARGLSEIVGIDARDLAAKPLFAARLRHPVPFGLHGYFRPAPAGR